MYNFAITNGFGQFWTGGCFGGLQAAEIYQSADRLPRVVELNNGICLDLDLRNIAEMGDLAYYAGDSQEPGAWFVVVR